MAAASDAVPWLAVVGAALAFDAVLVVEGRESLTARAARHRRATIAGLVLLGCHLLGQPRALAPYDPLRLIAQRLSRG